MNEKKILEIIKENITLAKKGRYWKRAVLPKLLSLLNTKHIISLVGVRRCGKSTLLKEVIRSVLKKVPEENIFYLNLEHPFFNQFKDNVNYLDEIYGIFKKNTNPKKKIYVFLDEIQFFTDWQVFIKKLYELNEAKIFLTGSNSKLLSSELSSMLSGRNISVNIFPFSPSEAKSKLTLYLTEGGFPEVVLKLAPKELLAETYYKNILYQDVIPRFKVKNILAIENLSYYLLSNIGKEISFNTLKSIAHLDDKTAKEYIGYLEDANLLYVIYNYDFSLKKIFGNKKKVYLVDPLFSSISFKISPDKGRLFENYIFMSLKRMNRNIFFHSNGGECDFIIKEGHKINLLLQVSMKLTKENKEREINGLLSAMKKFDLKEGFIVTLNDEEKLMINDKTINIITEKTFRKKFGMNSEN